MFFVKILHVVSSLNVGGAERFVIDLAYEQRSQKNNKVAILTMGSPGEPLEKELTEHGVVIHFATKISALRKLIQNFDVVNIHSSHCLLRILLAAIANNKTKIVYTRHNERVHTSLKWRITYALARLKLNKMIFVAQKAQDNFLRTYPQFTLKSQVILNGVLPISTKKSPSNKVRLGHIGRFVPLKAQHHLIEALSLLSEEQRSGLSLNYFGTGEQLQQKCKTLAKQLIPDVDVVFSGFVAQRDIIFNQIDILVVTSETEGLSLAILEALASGTPIIASDVGGNPELVHPNKNGFLYPYNDYQALAEKITALSSQAALYTQFSLDCQQRYQARFSMRRCSAEYIGAYSKK